MPNDPTYHDGMRQLQDARDARGIADRLEDVLKMPKNKWQMA